MYYHESKTNSKGQAMLLILSSSLFWCIGYGGMFVGKWLLAWYISDTNTVVQSLNQLKFRMSGYITPDEVGQVITSVHVILKNLFIIFNEPVFMVLMFILIWSTYKLHKTKKEPGNQDFTALKYAFRIIMLYPFLWYAILSNHSYVHTFFTYRTLAILVFAEGCYITTCFKEKETIC